MSRNQWIRHRLRSMIWKQWEGGKARYAKLRQLGVRKDLAAQTAGSPLAARGDWRIVPPCILRCPLRTVTCLLAVRCPVYRSRDSNSGFRTELENLDGDAKGKGTSGSPTRPKVPMRRPGADCFVVAMNRINLRGAKGAGHPRRDQPESTGNRRNSLVSTEGGSLRWVARAAISRETYVRFCERPEVKFLGPTRRRAPLCL